ncbi:MAG TPA: transglycosylase domain-containing protein [Candidatus Dormibacteraeota bacterium]|nr:transglycosylase domain-containing protein [Candidatus Dormibacteraeota bacterium]
MADHPYHYDPRPRPRAASASRAARARAEAETRRRNVRRAIVSARRAKRLNGRQRIAAAMLSVAVAAFVLVWGGGQVALAMLDSAMGGVPPAKPQIANSVVVDRNGDLIAVLHPQGDSRIPVSLDNVAPTVPQATVAIEDKAFWNEGAVDLGRVAGAAFNDVVHHDSQGASTITMQLAKVLYLQDQGGFSYKVKQLLVARHLDASMTKRQILQDYLNDIYYGHGATGIAAAAHIFFGVDAMRLTLAQSALLAGLPNHPTDLDPLRHPDAAKARQKQVLQAMVGTGAITAQQAAEADAEPLKYSDGNMDNVNNAPAFVGRVVAEIHDRLHLDAYKAGLHIAGTLDLAMNAYAQNIVTTQVDAIRGLNVSDGAMVSMDPQSGSVLVYVGGAGPGHPGSEIDMASSPRQPGSTFKLFTYSSALASKKVNELTPIKDEPYKLPTGGGANGMSSYEVHNYDMRYHGTLPLMQAFSNSLNIPAVKVEQLVGVPNVLKTARAMGVSTLTEPDNNYGASLTLGSYPVPLWEMAQAGSIFAAGGLLHPATFVSSVKDGGGKELLPAPAAPKPALDPGVAFLVNDILTNDSNREISFGRGSALTLPNHLVAAKTGTTQDFRDNLTVGWTPRLVTATWVGNTDNAPMRGTTGITGAAPIWHAFMDHQLTGMPDNWPPAPANVHRASQHGRDAWFLDGTAPDPKASIDSGSQPGAGCRTWSFNGGSYYWCGGGTSNLPGDPGGGAVPAPAPPPGNGNGHGDGGGGGGG